MIIASGSDSSAGNLYYDEPQVHMTPNPRTKVCPVTMPAGSSQGQISGVVPFLYFFTLGRYRTLIFANLLGIQEENSNVSLLHNTVAESAKGMASQFPSVLVQTVPTLERGSPFCTWELY